MQHYQPHIKIILFLYVYLSSRTIYEKLASAFIDDTKVLYLQRCEEIIPNIRYCAYNLGETDINDLVNLRKSAAGQDLLLAKIDVCTICYFAILIL